MLKLIEAHFRLNAGFVQGIPHRRQNIIASRFASKPIVPFAAIHLGHLPRLLPHNAGLITRVLRKGVFDDNS